MQKSRHLVGQRSAQVKYTKIKYAVTCKLLSFGTIAGNILMIVGGKINEGEDSANAAWKSSDKAYALSLNRKIDVPRCLESICDFDHYVTYPTTAIFQDGLPTVCGGTSYSTSPATNFVECFKYNFTNAWSYSGSLEQTHGYGIYPKIQNIETKC